MKKLLSLFLVMILLFSCIACGKTEPVNNDSTTTKKCTTENTFKSDIESTTVEKSTTEIISEENTTIIEENTTKAEKEDTTKKNTSTTNKISSTQKTEDKTTSNSNTKPTTTQTTQNKTTTETTKSNTPTASVVTSNDIAKIKSGFLRLVNEERARKGVQSLSTNQTLTSAASSRSYEILNAFSHTRPNGTPFYTIIDEDAYPYPQYTGENIQMSSHMGSKPYTKNDMFVGREDQITAAYTTIFNNFKNSSGHYANIINGDFCNTGIGISYKIDSASGMAIFYIVQIFGA